MKNFFLKSMGCKSNQFEGAIIEENLLKNGFVKVTDINSADIFILNSCTVTQKSDSEALYLLRNAKNTNPKIKTLITGCIAQVEQEKLLENNFIDYVLGNNEKLNVAAFLQSSEKFNACDIMSLTEFNKTELSDIAKTRASLKIQDGCDNRCSYCIIPFARGQSRSADEDFILKQINMFEKQGFKEVVFTGIHIGQWGKESDKTLLNLLKTVEANSNVRYRLGSLNPLEITDELLEFLRKSTKFCPHFHLSLQSACNRTLQRMNRFYKVEDYLEQIEKITQIFDKPFIGSDIIAGFAGETEEDFQITLKNLESSKLSAIHTFPYSIRKNTQAEGFEGHLPESVKEQRATLIRNISKNKTQLFLDQNIGSTHTVLIEKHPDKRTGYLKGVSENYITVLTNSVDENLINTLQKVTVTKIVDGRAYGEITG